MITITSVEVKDPRVRPLTDDEIKNGITVKFDYKAFMEGAKNTEQANQHGSAELYVMSKCRYCGVELPGDWRDTEHRKLCKNATPEVRYIHSGIEQKGYPDKNRKPGVLLTIEVTEGPNGAVVNVDVLKAPVGDTAGDNPDQLLLDFTEHGKADCSETGGQDG